MAILKKVFGTDITYLFDGSYQQLFATMIYFPLGEEKAKLFAEVDSNSNNDVVMWNKPYDGNMEYHCVETSQEKDVLLMLWNKRSKEIRDVLSGANVPDVDKLLTFPDYSYLFYTINENAGDDVPEKKYNFVLTGWGCQSGIQIHQGSDNASQQKREAENRHQDVNVLLVNENRQPICNHIFEYTYQNGLSHTVNSNAGKVELGLCLVDSEFVFIDTETSLRSSFSVLKGQSEYTLMFVPPKEEKPVEPVKPQEPIVEEPKPEPPITPQPLIARIVKVVTESLLPIPFYSLQIITTDYRTNKVSNENGLIVLPEEWQNDKEFEVYDELSGKTERYTITDDIEYLFVIPDKKPIQEVFVRVVNQKGTPISTFPLTIQRGEQILDVVTDDYGVYMLGSMKVDDEFVVACTEAKQINKKYIVEKDKDEYVFQIEQELTPITVTLLDKKKTPIPGAMMTLTNGRNEKFEHYTDGDGNIVVPRAFFTDKEDIQVHVDMPDTNVRDCKFKYEEQYDHYNIIIKDPFPWKKLLRLLALLLLFGLLFVRCNKDITIKTIEIDETPVSGAQVEMSYTEHQLYKDGTFFYSMTHVENGITDVEGFAKFEKQPCSVFSWIFYTLSRAYASASKDGRSGAGSFLFHWRFTPYVIVLEKDIYMRVIDAQTKAPIYGANVQLTSKDLKFKPLNLTTDQNGICSFSTSKKYANIDKILATAVGYSGSLMYNLSIQEVDSMTIPLDPPASCDAEVNNGNHQQGNHAIRDFNMGQQGGQFLFEYYTDSAPDHIMIYDGTSSDYAAGNAKLLYDYDGATNTTYYSVFETINFSSSCICVVVDNGTNWGYFVHCPN